MVSTSFGIVKNDKGMDEFVKLRQEQLDKLCALLLVDRTGMR